MKEPVIYLCRAVSIYFAFHLLTAGIAKFSFNYWIALALVIAFEFCLVYAGKKFFLESMNPLHGIVFAVFVGVSFVGSVYYMYSNPQKVANQIKSSAVEIAQLENQIKSNNLILENFSQKGIATKSQSFLEENIKLNQQLNELRHKDKDIETTLIEFLLAGAEFIGLKADTNQIILGYGLIRAILFEFVGLYLMFSGSPIKLEIQQAIAVNNATASPLPNKPENKPTPSIQNKTESKSNDSEKPKSLADEWQDLKTSTKEAFKDLKQPPPKADNLHINALAEKAYQPRTEIKNRAQPEPETVQKSNVYNDSKIGFHALLDDNKSVQEKPHGSVQNSMGAEDARHATVQIVQNCTEKTVNLKKPVQTVIVKKETVKLNPADGFKICTRDGCTVQFENRGGKKFCSDTCRSAARHQRNKGQVSDG